ncbi:hypothetical protein F5Y10DRAFT_254177 [Nemania abortiva]|nr:hypothetical protein F5Y10DRAFT_254177 [Nemania abortiva]
MLPKVRGHYRSYYDPIIDDASGFSPMSIDDEYFCTSAITTPMAFLLDPNISTADIYTTLPPELWIEHDQVTVQWEPSDLELFPVGVASQYEIMMGITEPPSTEDAVTRTTQFVASPATAPPLTMAPTTPVIWFTPSSSMPPPRTTPEPNSSSSGSESRGNHANEDTRRYLSDSIFVVVILVGIITALML